MRGESRRDGRENLEPAPTPRPSPAANGGEGQKVLIGWNTGDRRFAANSAAKPPGKGKLRLRQPSPLRPARAAQRPLRLGAGAAGRKGRPLQPNEQPAAEDHQNRRHQSFTSPAASDACCQVSQYKYSFGRRLAYQKSFASPARAIEDTQLQRIFLKLPNANRPRRAFQVPPPDCPGATSPAETAGTVLGVS